MRYAWCLGAGYTNRYVTYHHPEPQGNGQVNTQLQYGMINETKEGDTGTSGKERRKQSFCLSWCGDGFSGKKKKSLDKCKEPLRI